MLRNKIMILAIGILSFGGTAGAASLYGNSGPAELPPANFKGKQYIDSKGCVYIKAGYGTRITWVPRVNRKRQVYCNSRNKPSLNAAQLAAISGEPATRVVKPVAKTTPATAVKQPTRTVAVKPAPKPAVTVAKPTTITVAPTPQTTAAAGSTLPPHPSDVIRSQNGGVYTPPTGTPQYAAPVTSVRGTSPFSRSSNRDAIRTGPQAVHPADVIKAEKDGRSSQLTTGTGRSRPIVPDRVDPAHGISIYPVLIGSDITPRGDAQMAMIWTNTVPRRLIKQERARQVASVTTYRVSTKMR